MAKKIQILFLWLAGLLILAHQAVPHHHHNIEDDSCAIETVHHEHSSELLDTQSCHCDHANQHSTCELDLKSIEKHNTPVFLYLVSSLLNYNTSNVDKQSFFITNDRLLYNLHLFEYSQRGPPKLS